MKNLFALCCLSLLCMACAHTQKVPTPMESAQPARLPKTELSVFDAHEAGCVWSRLSLPEAKLEAIASFPFPCPGMDVAWSEDLTRAVVSFYPNLAESSDDSAAPPIALQAFEVEIATGKRTPLPLSQKIRGEFNLFGISPEGIVALSLENSQEIWETLLREIENKKKTFKTNWDNEEISIELPDEESFIGGMPELAHAWLLKNGTWKRIESKYTTTGWDYGFGVADLNTYGQLAPMAGKLLDVHNLPEAQEVKEVEPLSAWTPKSDDTRERWEKQSTPHGDLFAWMTAAEFDYVTGLLLYQPKEKALAPLPGLSFTQEDSIALWIQGPWLLVATKDTGTQPHVYDLRSGELVWSSKTARAVVFWPK